VLAATSLFQRSVQLGESSQGAIGRDLDLAEALYSHGSLAEAKIVLDRAGLRAATAGDRADELRVLLVRTIHDLATDPEGATGRLDQLADEGIRLFEQSEDEVGLTHAWFALGVASHVRARYRVRNEALERALVHAVGSGDSVRARTIEVLLAAGHLYGPTPVPDALAWLLEHPHLEREPNIIGIHAVLKAMSGRIDEARALCRHSTARSDELGTRYERGSFFAEFRVELLAGDAAAAADYARASCAQLERMGERSVLSTQAGQLGQALCALGRYDEAAEWSQRARELGASEDALTQMLWRQVEAKILAHRGSIDAGARFAREAVAIAEHTEAPDAHADALVDLARVLTLGDQGEQAAQAASEALALYKRKGNTVMAEQTRALMPSAATL
jgi:tetratricopeptide (TPR) repeat protein